LGMRLKEAQYSDMVTYKAYKISYLLKLVQFPKIEL
jgi:hypothetical protein